TSAPASSTMVATDDQGAKQGALTSGDTTDDTALVLSGTNEAGATVEVFNGGVSLGTATVLGTTWSYTATVVDGTSYQFNTKETDTTGNESAASSDFTVTGDTSAPTASSMVATDDQGAKQGALTSGGTTDDTALVLSGSNEAGAAVEVFNNGSSLGAATVTGTTWSYTATVADGTSYQFNTKETDTAGNESAASSDFTVTGDTSSPMISEVSIPGGTMIVGDVVTAIISVENDQGVVCSNVSGTIGGFSLGNLTRLNSTTYTAEYTVTEGGTDIGVEQAIPVSLTIEDAAGNTSATYSQSIAPSPAITDDSITYYRIHVSSDLNASDLDSVGFDVVHTYVRDLVFDLIAPDGSQINLVTQEGSSQNNFTNTVIATEGGSIGTASAPFTGTYSPEEAFSHLTGTAEGVWTLVISDVLRVDVGYLNNWSVNLPDFNGIMAPGFIDANSPTIASVSVADGTYQTGDSVAVTITASNNEAGLTLSSASFNGQALTGIRDNNNGTYSANYTVVEADGDIANAGRILTNLAFTDTAGNTGAVTTSVTPSADTSIVVFDLVHGVSSSHDGGSGTARTFSADEAYTIYIMVDSTAATLITSPTGAVSGADWGMWNGADNLGANDRVILAGSGGEVVGKGGAGVDAAYETVSQIQWGTGGATESGEVAGRAMWLTKKGSVVRSTAGDDALVRLWQDTGTSMLLDSGTGSALFTSAVPGSILTSQGLI
ncbi:MAG: subtilisin-like proprotein convertase family protein, partial [Motiliproteus sp.]